jgi:hypothetical protein
MLGKNGGINRPHTLLGGIAKKQGIQATAYYYSNRSLRFGSVHTRSVIAPIGGRTIRIDEGKFEQAIAVKGFPIDRYLTCIIEDRRYCLHTDSYSK